MRSPRECIKEPKGKNHDYFADLTDSDAVLQSIVALSNSCGGTIIIGKKAKGKIVGVQDPFASERELQALARQHIEPSLPLNICFFSYQQHTLLLVDVSSITSIILSLKDNKSKPQYWYRLADKNLLMTSSRLASTKTYLKGLDHDEQLHASAKMKDLDLAKLQNTYGKQTNLDEQTILALGLGERTSKGLRIKNGAVALFGIKDHDPVLFLSSKRETRGEGLKINKSVTKPSGSFGVLKQFSASATKHFIKNKQLVAESKDAFTKFVERCLFEALLNADFSPVSFPIRIDLEAKAVVIRVSGALFPGHSTEALEQGIAKVKNRLIQKVLLDSQQISGYGSSVPELIVASRELGVEAIELKETADGFTMTLTLGSEKAQVKARALFSQKQSKPNQGESIMGLLSHGPLSARELLSGLGLKTKTGGFKKVIDGLLESGSIEYTIPDKPKSRNQKYQLSGGGS